MGQYHKLVNLDTLEWVDPSGLGLGAKQYEQTGVDGSLSDALYLLTMTSPQRGGGDWPITDVSGRWVGSRVVVLGDYTEAEDLPEYDGIGSLYERVTHTGTDITPQVRDAFSKVYNIAYTSKEVSGFEFWNRVLA
jgi:hypothetical protein